MCHRRPKSTIFRAPGVKENHKLEVGPVAPGGGSEPPAARGTGPAARGRKRLRARLQPERRKAPAGPKHEALPMARPSRMRLAC